MGVDSRVVVRGPWSVGIDSRAMLRGRCSAALGSRALVIDACTARRGPDSRIGFIEARIVSRETMKKPRGSRGLVRGYWGLQSRPPSVEGNVIVTAEANRYPVHYGLGCAINLNGALS